MVALDGCFVCSLCAFSLGCYFVWVCRVFFGCLVLVVWLLWCVIMLQVYVYFVAFGVYNVFWCWWFNVVLICDLVW